MKHLFYWSLLGLLLACSQQEPIIGDVVLHNGIILDGTGQEGYSGQVVIKGDKIVYVGKKCLVEADTFIDVEGKAISPGFINMLSWAYNSLMEDGRSLSDLKQGVTLEVFGEGTSAGPRGTPGEEGYVSFGEAMKKLEVNGVSTNFASYLGAATVRIQTVGYENRKATKDEMERMRGIVQTAMEEGAMGIGSSLIYAPGDYADTEELIELCRVAQQFEGKYISHMRNEDKYLMEALDEFLTIAREASIPSEIYHLKASREPNWHLLDSVIQKVEEARAEGLKITADIYTYNASSTGLTGVIPTWVQEGGHRAWINRMKVPAVRERLLADIRLELAEQDPAGILMVGFNRDSMKQLYQGMTIAEAALKRGQTPEETIVDLIIEDDSRIQCIYFSMSEENISKKVKIPWVSFCSDAGSYSDLSKDFRTHPRAFGSFIRVLGQYTRDEKVLTLPEAVHKLSGLPAQNLGLNDRGLLQKGYYADLVVFDPEEVADQATFEDPLQFATGVYDVFVNGAQVLKNGEHTGVFSGRYIRNYEVESSQ
jgi:N-acyl-D-amino-acid deacylase